MPIKRSAANHEQSMQSVISGLVQSNDAIQKIKGKQQIAYADNSPLSVLARERQVLAAAPLRMLYSAD
ncbi:MAG: hypothetical protein ACR2Q4_20940 [Geminicoccaceae bacterium]